MADTKEGLSSKWPTILLTGLVSLLVGVVSALILDYLRTSSAKLEYDVISSASFSGQVQKLGMVAIEMNNLGRQTLEDVSGRITTANGDIILETKIEGFPAKGLVEAKTTNSVTLDLPFMNPSERGRILLLIKSESGRFDGPTVELRAKGVTASKRTTEKTDPKDQIFVLLATAALATMVSMFIGLNLARRKHARELRMSVGGRHHSADQRDIAAFVFDLYGLPEAAASMRFCPRNLSFWSIADSATQQALSQADMAKIEKTANALTTLLRYAAIADDAIALIHLNIARLHIRQGALENAKAELKAARQDKSELVEKRIELLRELKLLTGLDKEQDV